ncbi:MAG: DegV family EDD domain-containing protein [Agathobacter sp.]|nr:DegV family EDD domain-containing protein [Agathobacter sp.]
MFKKFLNVFIDDKVDIKERLFRIILVVGTIAIGLAILQGLTLVNADGLMPVYWIMFASFVAALVLTFKYNYINISSTILGFAIILIALPFIFLKGGGVNSGSGIWLCLGIVYVFIMFSGKKMWLFLVLTLITDIVCYMVSYYYPEVVVELATPFEKHFDSIFAAVIVGLTVGIIMKFQLKIFDNERQLTQEQKKELELLGKSKDAFFASMSHEIRTPINSIIGLNELILREEPSAEIQGYAKNIQNASKMLLSLVNDILDLSQLEIQKMELAEKEYSVEEMLHEVVDMMQVRMEEKNLKFVVQVDKNIPSMLYGDERRIKQILLNILSNAVKYTEQGSVTFNCRFEQVDEENISLHISVADTGMGIRKEELEHLFDAFHRINPEKNQKIEGTGLGLSITKHLLSLMQGEISVDSIYTQGSEFTVLIPQKIVDDSPMGEFTTFIANKNTATYYSKSFEAPEARILIVDDDDLNLIITTKLLQDTKMSIDTASSVDECLRKTSKRYYNLILMDYMMPGMNGGELLREVRKQENGLCKDSDVVLLSANVLVDKQLEYQQMGFDGLLEKPVDAVRLENEVMKHIPDELIEYRRDALDGIKGEYFVSRLSKHRKKIYITSDGVCDLPQEFLEKYDIKIIDMYIKTETGRFRDKKEIDIHNLSRYLSDENTTAFSLSPTVEDYERFFADALMEADNIIYISMASGTGNCYEHAVEAAKGFAHVHVVDSTHISSGQALVVLHAAKMASEGAPVQEIVSSIERMKSKVKASYVIPSTRIFYQKGFTDKITAQICDWFKLHPVLGTYRNKITVLGVRSGKLEKVWKKFIRFHLRNSSRIDTDIVFVVHAGCTVRQQELLLEEINRNMRFKQVIFTQASAASVCNAGLGSFGFAIYQK